jgi:predicted nucleotidyltransferase
MEISTIDIVQIKEAVVPILKEAGVTSSAIFGSYAAGEQTKDSDVDILIEPPQGMTLFGLVDLKDELEGALGKEVDVITYNSIYPPLKKHIFKHQVPLF